MNNTTELGHELDQAGLSIPIIFQTILFAVVCLVGLVGNTLVIYVVIRFSKMQTVTNMYIVNLAIADECFLIGIPFLIVTMVNNHWIFGYYACKAYMISSSIQFTSSIFLCIMSADRYIAVCHPISSPKWRTPFISRVVSVTAWTISFILMLPIITHANLVDKHIDTKSCVIDWNINSNINNNTNLTTNQDNAATSATIFTSYTFVCVFVLPSIMIFFFYCLVIKKLKTVGPKNKSKEKKRSHRKVTNLVLTVVTVYVFCWLPYWITQIAMLASPPRSSSSFVITLHLMASCLSYSNSAMNPILYAFLSDNFKKSFLKACTCAAEKDINATLHMENSVFPRKNKHQGSEKVRPARGTSICPNNDDEYDMGPLVSRGDQSTSAITMTSRTNITSLGDSREAISNSATSVKNGNALILVNIHPTCL